MESIKSGFGKNKFVVPTRIFSLVLGKPGAVTETK